MKFKTRISAITLTACMVLSAVPTVVFAEGTDTITVSRINVQGERSAVYSVINMEFAAKNQNVSLVYNADEQAGDILVDTQGAGYETSYGAEGYGIAVDHGIVTVEAAGEAGAAYGLRDVLKQLEAGREITDKISSPFSDTRALFVDCARKYFDVEWFETIIREMAWNGMNTLYMSFSQDEGFRFLLDDMGISFPDENGNEIVYDHKFMRHLGDNPHTLADSEFLTERNEGASDVAQGVNSYDNSGCLTEADMKKIIAYAKVYGVNIIPEFNSPGHTGQILWYFPEYRNVGIWGIGTNPCYAMDLENQEAKNFMTALIKKYVDFFSENGCTGFCVGGDEFKAYESTDQTIADYVNNLVNYVESKGMTAYAWVDGQAGTSGLLKDSVIVNDWKSGGAKASDYQVVNFNSDYMYYVLKASGDWWLVEPKNVFETWHPLLFNGDSAVDPDSEAAANVRGACMAVWCDDAAAKGADVILNDMMTDIKSFGYRVWNYDPAAENVVTYEDFIANATSAAALEEENILHSVNSIKQLPQLENQLHSAEGKAGAAQNVAASAQSKLTEAEKRVTAAEQKVSAAKDKKEKLTAEAELCAAKAEANKLAAEAAEKKADAAKKKAEVTAIEAQILAINGSLKEAAAKETESDNLIAEASGQEAIAQEKQNAQAGLDKEAEAKKTELTNYEKAANAVTTVTVKDIEYKILDAEKQTAAVIGTKNKNLKSAVIKDKVSIHQVTYKVTQINAKAFKGLKNLKNITIAKNIKKIEKEAFAGCGKLSKVNMKKATGITSIGKKAFSKINAKAKVTVPSKKKAKYKNLLKKAGLPKKASVK